MNRRTLAFGILALILLGGCATERPHGKHPYGPHVAPARPMPPCLNPICVVPA